MGLFGKRKATCRCSDEGCHAQAAETGAGARLKILGSGCAKCNALEANARAALQALSMDASIEHVTDFAQIASYGVMATPALVVDGKVVSSGKLLKAEEIAAILQQAR